MLPTVNAFRDIVSLGQVARNNVQVTDHRSGTTVWCAYWHASQRVSGLGAPLPTALDSRPRFGADRTGTDLRLSSDRPSSASAGAGAAREQADWRSDRAAAGVNHDLAGGAEGDGRTHRLGHAGNW